MESPTNVNGIKGLVIGEFTRVMQECLQGSNTVITRRSTMDYVMMNETHANSVLALHTADDHQLESDHKPLVLVPRCAGPNALNNSKTAWKLEVESCQHGYR